MNFPLMIAIAGIVAWEKLAASSTLPARISGAVAAALGIWVAVTTMLRS